MKKSLILKILAYEMILNENSTANPERIIEELCTLAAGESNGVIVWTKIKDITIKADNHSKKDELFRDYRFATIGGLNSKIVGPSMRELTAETISKLTQRIDGHSKQ